MLILWAFPIRSHLSHQNKAKPESFLIQRPDPYIEMMIRCAA